MSETEGKFPFTKSRINALALPASGRDTYLDSKVSGLLIRISASGIKSFGYFKRTKGGDPFRETLGRFPDISVEQARERASLLNAEIAKGTNLTEIKRALKTELSGNALFEIFGERHGKHKKSWKDDQQRWRDYLAPAIGNRKLSQIRREDIANTIHKLATTGNSPGTQRQVRALASSVFSKAIQWGLCSVRDRNDRM